MRHYNATEIKKLIRICHEQLYFNKFVNLQEMDKFLEMYMLMRLSHKEIENLSRQMTRWFNHLIIQKPPNKEKTRTRWLSEFHQTFREDQERIQILLTTAPWLMFMCLPACPPFLEDEPRVYTAAAPASSRARGEHTGTRTYVALSQWVNEETIFPVGGEGIKGVFSLIAAPLLFHPYFYTFHQMPRQI